MAIEHTLLLLGASGNLTERWLLPGLGPLIARRRAPGLALIGSGMRAWDDATWRAKITESFATVDARGPEVDAFVGAARYLQADVTREEELRRLLAACAGRVILYFALPPAVTERACRVLASTGVPDGTQLVVEKPFGTDVASARALNELLAQIVPEESVYRVDHYLAMHTVHNLIGLRFANRALEPLLRAEHVQRVDVVSEERLGIAGRARYYDRAGALIDVTQSHLLQVLAMIAMDAPARLDARELRDRKVDVLRATRVWNDDPIRSSRRARYTAGTSGGERLPSYVDEEGVDPARNTETFAEIVLEVGTPRWAGVPFFVRTGKALRALRRAVVITFRAPPWMPIGLGGGGGGGGGARPNRLVIGLEPPELRLDLDINAAGDRHGLEPISLAGDVRPADLPPYGEILGHVLARDPTLSVRADMAIESWRIVEPVVKAWREGAVPLQEYAAGSAGPRGWPSRERPGEEDELTPAGAPLSPDAS